MKCRNCEEEKEEKDFAKGRRVCKKCASKKCMEWAKENKESILESSRKFREKNRELCRRRCLELYYRQPWKNKEWRKENPEKTREYQKKYRERNRESVNSKKREFNKENQIHKTIQGKARKAVYYAVKRGELVRLEKCQMCNKVCKPQAHHSDYTKPLEVIWVCTVCHGMIHRTLNGKI